jgi:hypothetical protein
MKAVLGFKLCQEPRKLSYFQSLGMTKNNLHLASYMKKLVSHVQVITTFMDHSKTMKINFAGIKIRNSLSSANGQAFVVALNEIRIFSRPGIDL